MRAVRVVFPNERNPSTKARQLLADPVIATAIDAARRRVMLHTEVDKTWTVNRLVRFVTADVNELVEGRRVPCRYCNGQGHRYQFRDVEMELLLGVYQCGANKEEYFFTDQRTGVSEFAQVYYDLGKAGRPFDPQGGDGYSSKAPIWSVRNGRERDCPACDGDGELRVFFHDTRCLSAAGKLLYEGFEVGKDGKVRLKIRDRTWAEQALLRHAGVAEERKHVLVRRLAVSEMTDEELRRGILELDAMIELDDVEFEEVEKNSDAAAG